MIFNCRKRERPSCEEWHQKFLWWPTRIDADHIAWLETVSRRLVVDDPGNWAGGFRAHWEYRP